MRLLGGSEQLTQRPEPSGKQRSRQAPRAPPRPGRRELAGRFLACPTLSRKRRQPPGTRAEHARQLDPWPTDQVAGGGVGAAGAGGIVCHRDRWRDQAEHAAQSRSKGSRVLVIGRLQQRTWTAEDGSARSAVEVVAQEPGPSPRWATATTRPTWSDSRQPARPAMQRCDERDAMEEQQHASVPLRRVRAGEVRGEEGFSTNSRPAIGLLNQTSRPPVEASRTPELA